jgi:hypothetical protein
MQEVDGERPSPCIKANGVVGRAPSTEEKDVRKAGSVRGALSKDADIFFFSFF